MAQICAGDSITTERVMIRSEGTIRELDALKSNDTLHEKMLSIASREMKIVPTWAEGASAGPTPEKAAADLVQLLADPKMRELVGALAKAAGVVSVSPEGDVTRRDSEGSRRPEAARTLGPPRPLPVARNATSGKGSRKMPLFRGFGHGDDRMAC